MPRTERATRIIFITFLVFFMFAAKQLTFPIVSSSVHSLLLQQETPSEISATCSTSQLAFVH
uniref:Uncharacterized protein n=1 Tax=Solanum lycopersicum TaxID=4081 RepID=A0A3Q7E9F4_SOLLC